MSMSSETGSPQVKAEQEDPLAKSSSEVSEEEKDNLDSDVSDVESVNTSSLLGHSRDEAFDEEVAGENLNEEVPRGDIDEEVADDDLHAGNAVGGVSKTGEGVEAVKAGGKGSAEMEVIVIDDSDDSDSAEEVEMEEETNQAVIIKTEPKSDTEPDRRAKEPDAQEPYGSDQDTVDTDASVTSCDPEGGLDGEDDDDRNEVSQNHDDDIANGHGDGGVDEESAGGRVANGVIEGGGTDDEEAGDVQLHEVYDVGWLKEMAVGPNNLFYSYMVRSVRCF